MILLKNIKNFSSRKILKLRRQAFSHFDPRFKYESLTYHEHRPYVEQCMLNNVELFPKLYEQHNALLASTRAWVERHSKEPASVFLSYARPILQEFPSEFWHQIFLVNLALDLKKSGFSPLMDVLNFSTPPDMFMANGVKHCQFVILSGSKSMLHKQNHYPDSFVKKEIGYIEARLKESRKAAPLFDNSNFLLGAKLSDQPMLESFPHIFHGKCDVYEFTDNQGNFCKSYLDYLLEIIKKMMFFSLPNKNLTQELDMIWEDNLKDIFGKTSYLSENNFNSVVESFKKRDQAKEYTLREHIKECVSRIDYASMGADKDRVVSNVMKESFEKKIRWNIPPAPEGIHFIGRTEELNWINEQFSRKNDFIRLGFYGLPGIGIAELIHKWRLENDTYFDAVFYFDGSSEDILNTQLNDFCRELGIIKEGSISSKEISDKFKKHFEEKNTYFRWLIIFDNIEHLDMINSKMPSSSNGCVFLTATNLRKLESDSLSALDILEIQQMQVSDSVNYFKEITEMHEENMHDLEELVQALGCLPLAMRAAAYWIRIRGGNNGRNIISAKKFLHDFHSMNSTNILSLSENNDKKLHTLWEMILRDFNAREDSHHRNAIFSILKCLAYLSPYKIPDVLIKSIIKNISKDMRINDIYFIVVAKLMSASLISEFCDNCLNKSYYYINPLMQKFIKNKYPLVFDTQKKSFYKATDANFLMRLLVTNVSYDEEKMHLSVENFDLLPHAEAFLKNVELGNYTKKNDILCELYYVTAQLACYKAEHQKALYFFEKAKVHLSEHCNGFGYKLSHAIGQLYLAMHRNRNDYSTAALYLTQASRLAHNPSSDYAAIVNDLARLQYDIGDYKASVVTCNEVIQICLTLELPEKSLAYVIHDLAMAHLALGHLNDAKEKYKKSLYIKKMTYGEKNVPTIAATLLGLGQVYYLENDIQSSIQFFKDSLAMSEICFPKETHPRSHNGIAAAHNDIACCYFKLGNISCAFEHFFISLEMYLNLSNLARNVDSAVVIYNLALLALFLKKEKISRNLMIYAFSDCKDSIGEEHSITKKIRASLNLNEYDSVYVLSDNLGDYLKELKAIAKEVLAHPEKYPILFENFDLILSNRYGFFRAIKPQLLSSDDQGLNLFLSTG